jgi:energy-coupling factor transport system permease protein
VIGQPQIRDRERESLLGRTSPLVKLALAGVWLVGMALTLDPRVPAVLAAVAAGAALGLGSVTPASFVRGAAPLWLAAAIAGILAALLHVANADPSGIEVARAGPLRLTEAGLIGGLAIGLRIVAIGAVSVLLARTTDATALTDALAQQGRVPERFAYGALAAYGTVPRLGQDLATIRQARRVRGLSGGWHPRVLVALLVLAIRRGDRMALAMDARAFGLGPRSRYRVTRWSSGDGLVLAGGILVVAAVLVAFR